MTRTFAYLHAEGLRTRGSALQWLPLLGILLAFMSLFFSQLATADGSARSLLGWQAMYVTGMAAPLTAIFAAIPEIRELSARYGGLLWRPVSPRRLRAGRLVAVWTALAAFIVLNFGLTWLLAVLLGLSNARIVLIAGVWSWVASLGVSGLSAALVRRYGFTAALAAAFIFQFAGIPASITEGNNWWMFPPAWPIRLILPVIGIHTNSVPLEPGDPLLHESPWPAAGLCLLLAAVGALTACWVPPRHRHRHGRVLRRRAADFRQAPVAVAYRSASTAGRAATVKAIHRAALNPVLVGCVMASILALAITAAVYPVYYVHGLFTFAVLPVGTGITAILVWSQLQETWPLMLVENRFCLSGLIIWLNSMVAVVSTVAAVAGLAAGGSLGDELRRWVLSVVVGTVLVLAAMLLVVHFNAATAAAVTVIWTIVSLTLGGDILADTALWIVALPSWPATAVTVPRISVAIVLGICSATVFARALNRSLALTIGEGAGLTLRGMQLPRI